MSPPFLQPPVLLDALSEEQRGAVNHLVRHWPVLSTRPLTSSLPSAETPNPRRNEKIIL